MTCPMCGSDNLTPPQSGDVYWTCNDCGADWNPNKKPNYGWKKK